MAIPVLYWMLECVECGERRVVHASFRAYEGPVLDRFGNPIPGAGDSERTLEDTHPCLACGGRNRAVAYTFGVKRREMQVHSPDGSFERRPMTPKDVIA